MPPKQPSMFDLMKEQSIGLLDPTITVPVLGAAGVLGAQQIGKRLPGAAAKVAPVVGSAAKTVANTASRAINTGLPFIDNTFNRGKAAFDHVVPRWMSQNIEPKAAPIRAAVQGAVSRIASSPVGKAVSAYNTRVAAPMKNLAKALGTGAPAKGSNTLIGSMMGSPAGDPYFEDAMNSRNDVIKGVVSSYKAFSNPKTIEDLLMQPDGEKKAKEYLGAFNTRLTNAGLPIEVRQHIIAAMRNPSAMDMSDEKSIKDLLMRFMPQPGYRQDPTFRQQGAFDVPLMDAVNSVTQNTPDIAASIIPALGAIATGGRLDLRNPLLDALKNSNSRGEDAIARYGDSKRRTEIGNINAALQRPKTKTTTPINMDAAQRRMMLFDMLQSQKGF